MAQIVGPLQQRRGLLCWGRAGAILTGHTKSVQAVAIAPDGSWLATGSWDGRRGRYVRRRRTGAVAGVRVPRPGRGRPGRASAPRRSVRWPWPQQHSQHTGRPPRIRTITSPCARRIYVTTPLMVTGFTFLSRLTQIAPPHTRFVFLGAEFRLGLPSHPASRRRSCLRTGVSTTSSSRGTFNPPSDRPCRAYSRRHRTRRRWPGISAELSAAPRAGRIQIGALAPVTGR